MKAKIRSMWTMIIAWLAAELYWLKQSWADQRGAIPIDSIFEIKETTPGFTLGSDVPVGSGDGVTESVYGTYKVPDGVKLVFLPTSEFQFYGKDIEASPVELTDYVPILLYHRDNSGQGTLYRGGGLYANCKFAANVNERRKLLDKWVAKPVEEIEIRVIAESGKSLDVSSCHFSLICRRIAPMLTP